MLEAADQLRESDRAQALAQYAEHQDLIEVTDEDRIRWICAQVAPTPPPSLGPLFRRVRAEGTVELKRAALHAMATCAWFEGRGADAEQLWGLGLRECGTERDRIWIRSCLNLAVAMIDRQCLFEPLVLTGMGARAARAAGLPYLEAFATLKRAGLLLDLGDLDRAQDSLNETPETPEQVTAPGPRRVIEHERRWVQGLLLRARGRLDEAAAHRRRHLAWINADPATEDTIRAESTMDLLEILFDLEPQDTDVHLDAFTEIDNKLKLGPTWRCKWERKLAHLRLRAAVASGDRAKALSAADTFLSAIRGARADSSKVTDATNLGRVLLEDLQAEEKARDAYDVASHACLNCVVQADRASRDIPELAEATPDDWHVLRVYRRRLADQQQDLLDAVASRLKPGAAAFDLIVQDDTIRICAWCSQVRTTEEIWRPLAHFVPPRPDQMVTHGICEPCRARFAPEDP